MSFTTTTATETMTTTKSESLESEQTNSIASSKKCVKFLTDNTTTPTTTIIMTFIEVLLTNLNAFDEIISGPVFHFGLPKWLELLYSFPACIFGTSFSLMTMPLWIAVLAVMEQKQNDDSSSNNNTQFLLLQTITIGVTAVYVIGWGLFQQYGRHDLGLKLFWRWGLYMSGTPWCLAILAYTLPTTSNSNDNNNNNDIFSMAIYPLFLFPFVLRIVNYLKKSARRHRPAYKDSLLNCNQKDNDDKNKAKKWIDNKKYPAMTEMLAKGNHDASFPSGDAALAALFAIPIFYIGSSTDTDTDTDNDGSYGNNYYYKAIGVGIVFLSASGRMYVLAHHLFDVLTGIATSYLIHITSTFVFGFGMYEMKWWYPLVSIASFLCYDKLKKMESQQKNDGNNDGNGSKLKKAKLI
mmetsp:Transcript_22252/g.24790  ORF Transcript_22252/g.24790 Transcript_22252/m.24790 type:complete len:408 (+) Transcript_22252:269-1492(+)